MICYVLYNKDTEAQRIAAQFADRIDAERVDVELLDADSPRGIQLAESYEIFGRPAVVLMKDDGSPMSVWQGEDGLPAPADVAYLAHQ